MKRILEVKDLNVHFNTYSGVVQAVRGVSFELNQGETLAIVGESGSGKSVTCHAVLRLLEKNAEISSGSIDFLGENIAEKTVKEMHKFRGKEASIIFQDPMSCLNPTMTIGRQIIESILEHQNIKKSSAKKKAINLLEMVGIADAESRYKQYPHMFSGGQRQRIMIAIALANDPKLLIADEPTTALDVTIQAQILKILKKMQKEFNTSILFITHDLGVVANMADRIAIMYGGKFIEIGSVDEIFYNPKHPYTWGLLQSIPSENKHEELVAIPGSPPNLATIGEGDSFYPRNPYALEIDKVKQPPMFKVSDTHYAATWLLDERAPRIELPKNIQERYEIFAKLMEEKCNE